MDSAAHEQAGWQRGRVVVAGPVTIDEVVMPGRRLYKMGGVSTYAGLTFCRLGLATTIVTNLAPAEEDLLQVLEAQGVTCQRGTSPATAHFINRVWGDERIQEMPARAQPLRDAQLAEVLAEGAHVHLGPLYPDDLAPDLLALVGARAGLVSLDVQGYLRHVEHGRVFRQVAGCVEEALRVAHVVKAEQHELALLLDAHGASAEDLLAAYDLRELVVTAGREGGRVVARTGAVVPYAGEPVARLADPTGAGDVFFAAYLAARFHEGHAVSAAAARAARVAARQVAGDYITEARLRLPASRVV